MRKINLSVIILLSFCFQSARGQNVTQVWASCSPDTLNSIYLNDMASDSLGNTYYTGYKQDSAYYAFTHFVLMKFSKDGAFEWVKSYPFPALDSFEKGNAVAVDKYGNVFVTGSRSDSFCNICTQSVKEEDQFTIKYSSLGTLLWINRYKGPKNTLQSPTKMIVLDNGNILVAGTEELYNNKTYDYTSYGYLHRINRNGRSVYVRKVKDLRMGSIAVDKNNEIVFGGLLLEQNLYQLGKVFIAKYSYTGDSLWSRKFVEPQKNGGVRFLKTDQSNNIYVMAQTDTITFYNHPRVMIMKYNPQGALLWYKKEPDHSYSNFSTSALHVDKNGNAFLASFLEPASSYNRNWLISKYSSNGIHNWSYEFKDSVNTSENPNGIVGDDQSNIYVSGVAGKAYNPYMYGTLALDSNGNKKWLKLYTSANRTNNFPVGIALAGGSIYTGGIASKGVCVVKYNLPSVAPKVEIQLQEEKAIENVEVFPNPAINYLQISTLPSDAKRIIFVYNSAGILVRQQALIPGTKKLIIPIGDLTSGLYFVKLNDNQKREPVSFIKK